MGFKIAPDFPDIPAAAQRAAPRTVHIPTRRQTEMYSEKRAKLCGACKDFNHAEGQKRLIKDKQLLAIVHDAGWQAEHLGDAPERMGVCAQHDDMAVGPTAFGCEHFRRK